MNTNSFIGVRSLMSFVKRSLTGEQLHVWGEDPAGQLIYTPTGHMSVTYMKRGRRKFASSDKAVGT